jgi:type I restriction enzyme M protein
MSLLASMSTLTSCSSILVVVGLDDVEENEFNLNIPRYVDTFEPEPRMPVKDALKALRKAEAAVKRADDSLLDLLAKVGYAPH